MDRGMILHGLMSARNEQWCLGFTARAALLWCDALVILDHASTDETAKIIRWLVADYPGRVHALRVDDQDWNEADHRQLMLDESRRHGATHLAVVDADELLGANLFGIRSELAALVPGTLLSLPWICCWRGLAQYRSDPASVWSSAYAPCLIADSPEIAWQAGEGNYQFHRRVPAGCGQRRYGEHRSGGLLHLQFVQWERLLAKQALYQVNELLRWPGFKSIDTLNAQYGKAVDEAGLETSLCLPEWTDAYRPYRCYLDLGDEPWQLAEVKRLVALHGRERFAGLSLVDHALRL